MKEKKYELDFNDSVLYFTYFNSLGLRKIRLYRIVSLIDFSDVKKGDKGGYIESYKNLSQKNDCWVYDNAKVFNNAKVYDNAKIRNNAVINENAQVAMNAEVYDKAHVCGFAYVGHKSKVYQNTIVKGNAIVVGENKIHGKAKISDNSKIDGKSEIFGKSSIAGYSKIINSKICFKNETELRSVEFFNAIVRSISDFMIIRNNFSSGRNITWTKSNNLWKTGCFNGTGRELIRKAFKDSKEKGKKFTQIVKFVEEFNNIPKDERTNYNRPCI